MRVHIVVVVVKLCERISEAENTFIPAAEMVYFEFTKLQRQRFTRFTLFGRRLEGVCVTFIRLMYFYYYSERENENPEREKTEENLVRDEAI